MHAAAFAAIWTGVSPVALGVAALLFVTRGFAISAGYHRLLSHRAYRASRPLHVALAIAGTSAAQLGPLWWAAHHRRHHRESDGPGDVHSPKRGFYYSHQGWIFDKKWQATRLDLIPDFAKYPEIQWLNRWHFVPPVALGVACWAIGSWPGLFWGFFLSTTLLWHSTYTINSLSHVFGTRRFDTDDTSKNNWMLALLTWGEGWHNNHHHYMASARQGFRWWEIDLTYYVLRGLKAVGVIWDVREPPAALKSGRPRETAIEREAA